MKGLILFITFLTATTLYGQMSEHKVHYSFKITEITNEENAKVLNAEISNYFDTMPIFNETDNLFVVDSRVLISKEQFEERMTAKGLHVELFEQTSGLSNATIKH